MTDSKNNTESKENAERIAQNSAVNNPVVNKRDYRTSIGGQALIEGVMMRGPRKQAVVVKTKDGFVTDVSEIKLLKDKYPIVGFIFIRGVVNLISSMAVGMRALMFSAECLPEEDQEEPSKFDKWVNEKVGSEKADKIIITLAMVLGIALSIGLFIILPTFLAGFISKLTENRILKSLMEGVLRIVIFLAYMWLATRLKDIKRVWAFHGAEHKAIFCYEKGLPLTVENARDQSRQHPRCGTSFMFIVMIVSIFVFSFTGWENIWIRIGFRLLLLPVVIAISYEIIKLAGRYDNLLTAIVSAPGKALQKLTTREPDDEMLETALEALRLVIPENSAEARW